MSKRMTGTEKWDDPWFFRLPLEYKCLWIYLLDKCDHAGLWKVNLELASFHLKVDFKFKDISKYFVDKIIVVNDDLWFIPNFVNFQYGKLNIDNKVHKSVISNLEKFNLLDDKHCVILSPLLGSHIAPCYEAKDKDKEKEKDKDQDKEKEKDRKISKETNPDENISVATFEDKIEIFMDMWNFVFQGTKVSQIKFMSEKRRALFKEALKDIDTEEDWKDAILGLRSSEFHMGEGESKWVADVDYFLGKTKKVYLSFSEKYKSQKELGNIANENHETASIGQNGSDGLSVDRSEEIGNDI